jgi:hypothetical protein
MKERKGEAAIKTKHVIEKKNLRRSRVKKKMKKKK